MAAKPFESKIQDIVYNVDVGIGLRLIKTFLYFLFIFVIILLYTATQFKGFDNKDAMDCAQIARNLQATKKFQTQNIRPASMWYLIEKSSKADPMINAHPDILHPPLYPAVLAAGLFNVKWEAAGSELREKRGGVFSPEKRVIVINHIFVVATAVLIFMMGNRLFDRRVALMGGTLYALSNMVWQDSLSGTALPMLTLIVTGAIFATVVFLSRIEDGKHPREAVVPFIFSVLLCILAFLTRYGAVALVPGLALVYGLSIKDNGWRWALVLVVAFLIGISPWLARNKMVSGGLLGLAPYTALNDSPIFEEDTFERSLVPAFENKNISAAIRHKMVENIRKMVDGNLRTIGDGFVVCFFLVGYFYRFVRMRVHLLRWGIALSGVALIVIVSAFGESSIRLLHVFWPVVMLYGLAFFYLLLDRLALAVKLLHNAVIGSFVVWCVLPLFLTLLPPHPGWPYPPYFPPYITHVSDLLKKNELMCTDMPWATAWYGDRSSLQLPLTLDEFYEINDYTKLISGLYFTTLTSDRTYARSLATGAYQSWFPILQGRMPPDFPLSQGFPLNQVDQLFLTDRARWAE
ncbi:MAG: glycosyltransferase family 39 protein [Verrucomicrobia bacterium]|nr:glycosyltransferase family 39 protein [Verrucomicrobiota bacterium]